MDETTTHVHAEGNLALCGASCTSGQAGHSLLPVQEVVVNAAPSAWRDAIVAAAAGGGLSLALLDDGELSLWHHAEAGIAVGDPVAYHPIAGVLAVGGRRLSVRAR